jgi:hypothetical protein
MKLAHALTIGSLPLVLVACATPGGFPKETAKDVALVPATGRIEVSLDRAGGLKEVEFHISPDSLPASVRAAADRLMPDGVAVAAEKEYVRGAVCYEITKAIAGKDWEVLFDADGNVVEWEIQIARSEAPAAVLEAARKATGGEIHTVEKILGPKKDLLEYHVKKEHEGIKYKIVISIDGEVRVIYRETPAEVEVPIG